MYIHNDYRKYRDMIKSINNKKVTIDQINDVHDIISLKISPHFYTVYLIGRTLAFELPFDNEFYKTEYKLNNELSKDPSINEKDGQLQIIYTINREELTVSYFGMLTGLLSIMMTLDERDALIEQIDIVIDKMNKIL